MRYKSITTSLLRSSSAGSSMMNINPVFPLEIFQRIIKDVSDMMFILKHSHLRFQLDEYSNLTRYTELDPKQAWEEWHQTLLSLALVCNSFKIMCRPHLMGTIDVKMTFSQRLRPPRSLIHWSPPALSKALQESQASAAKGLEEVKGLRYLQCWEEGLETFRLNAERSESPPPASLLLCLPALQSLSIDLPDYNMIYEYDDPPEVFRLHTLLQCYVFGRPEGFFEDSEDGITDTLSSRYNSWVTMSPTSSLTHLLLSHIENLPLIHLLTSSTLLSIHLYFCTAEWNQYVLLSSDDESSLSDNGEIVLVSSNVEESTLIPRPKPGFKLRSWKAIGEADVTPSLLQYCTLLEELDVTYMGEDSISPANQWQPQVPVQVIQQKLLPERVPLPLPPPFQKLQKVRYEGALDWAYFCNIAENAEGNVKLLPDLRELTLEDVGCDDCNGDTDDDSGPERVLLRHVEKLEVLRIIRGGPFAFNFREALLASSHSLKRLEIGWEIRSYHELQTDDCESTLCNGLEAIRRANRIEVLEVVFDLYKIRVDPLSFFVDVEDDSEGGSVTRTEDDNVRTCHWTRLSTLLSSNPSTDFPMLKRVDIRVTFHRVLEEDYQTFIGREDNDMDVAWKLQQRLDGLLSLDAGDGDPQTINRHGVDVGCRVAVRTENRTEETRINVFEVTRRAVTKV